MNRIDEQGDHGPAQVLSSSHDDPFGVGSDPAVNLLREGSSHNVGRDMNRIGEQDDHGSATSYTTVISYVDYGSN